MLPSSCVERGTQAASLLLPHSGKDSGPQQEYSSGQREVSHLVLYTRLWTLYSLELHGGKGFQQYTCMGGKAFNNSNLHNFNRK